VFKNLNVGALGHKVSGFEESVKLAAEYGFQGVDPDLGYARDKGVPAVKDLLQKHTLRLGGFGLSVRWRESDSDKDFAESLEGFVKECKLAAELGVTRCMTWVMPCSDKLTYRQHYELMVSRMRPAAQILKGFGQSLGLEFIGPRTLRASKKQGFVYTMDGMRAVNAAIGTGNVGFLLDCWHWYTAQATVTDIEQLDPAEVVYVHLNDAPKGVHVNDQVDNKRELPGTGVIDLKGFLGALRKIGYDGPITVEPFNEPLKKMPLAEALKTTAASLAKAGL